MKLLLRKALVCRALLIFPLVVLSVGAEPAESSKRDFTFDGRPVHPMSVQPFVGDLADEQPRIAAVDLEGSARTGSNRVKASVENGLVTARGGDNGFVAYRHIGTTPSGLHVLVVLVNGGGSGVFEDAVWVRLVRDAVWEDGKKRDRTMLVKVGSFPLGDRDDGNVRLDGATLFLGKSKYRDKDMLIPLD